MRAIIEWEHLSESDFEPNRTVLGDIGTGMPVEVYHDDEGRWFLENGDMLSDAPFYVIAEIPMPTDGMNLKKIHISAPPLS